jgi:hypothetical protein
MFQLLGMFSNALGMFSASSQGAAVYHDYNITDQSDNPLITESSDNIITE